MKCFYRVVLFLLIANAYSQSPKEYAQQMYIYGTNYYDEGDLHRAKNHFEYALHLYPHAEKIYSSLGYLYLELGNIHKAIDILNTAITNFPKNTEFLYHRAYFFTLIRANDKALNDWNRIIKIDQNNINARWQRGQYFFKHGEYEKAFEDFKKLDKHDPDSSKISTYFLAKTLYLLKKYPQAAKKFKEYAQALESTESNHWHPIGRVYFYIARNLRLSGNLKEASIYYDKSINTQLWPEATNTHRIEAQKYSNYYLDVYTSSKS